MNDGTCSLDYVSCLQGAGDDVGDICSCRGCLSSCGAIWVVFVFVFVCFVHFLNFFRLLTPIAANIMKITTFKTLTPAGWPLAVLEPNPALGSRAGATCLTAALEITTMTTTTTRSPLFTTGRLFSATTVMPLATGLTSLPNLPVPYQDVCDSWDNYSDDMVGLFPQKVCRDGL